MNRARAILIAAAGFFLGSLTTLLVLSGLGELGKKYASEPDPRLKSGRARQSHARCSVE